jgi:ribosomal protein S18 acetylase RimI-like enzyme
VTIETATIDDTAEILRLQRLAYRSEAKLYNDFTIQPLVQGIEELRDEFRRCIALKVREGGAIIGSVRAREEGTTCYIGKLMVHPDFQDRGIGTALMRGIEGRFAAPVRFELFTGHRSGKNIRLYTGLSYRNFKTCIVSESLTLLYFEKTIA